MKSDLENRPLETNRFYGFRVRVRVRVNPNPTRLAPTRVKFWATRPPQTINTQFGQVEVKLPAQHTHSTQSSYSPHSYYNLCYMVCPLSSNILSCKMAIITYYLSVLWLHLEILLTYQYLLIYCQIWTISVNRSINIDILHVLYF
jgi:hypothetical protein